MRCRLSEPVATPQTFLLLLLLLFCCYSAGYQVIADGHLVSVGGTSASTPVFAAMISLINEKLKQTGGAPLGFLNPFLYQNEERGFTDVIVGACSVVVCRSVKHNTSR